MKLTLRFSTPIQAACEVVWDTMFDPDCYRTWTTPFGEGSYFEGSWAEGERIRFLAPGGSGMSAVIAENRRPQFLSIQHLGEIVEGVEDLDSDRVRAWAPAFENYTLLATAGGTELIVDSDVSEEWEPFLRETWPKALAVLKRLCEERGGGG
ncbi:MAG: SRPBCC domain-containing protein [Thermoanaerobaculia bacterium]|nr:SRPBCC domain-containing protein [Thermoanaerobaculia bacterium]